MGKSAADVASAAAVAWDAKAAVAAAAAGVVASVVAAVSSFCLPQ